MKKKQSTEEGKEKHEAYKIAWERGHKRGEYDEKQRVKKPKEEIIYNARRALISLKNIEFAYKLEESTSLKNVENHLLQILELTKEL